MSSEYWLLCEVGENPPLSWDWLSAEGSLLKGDGNCPNIMYLHCSVNTIGCKIVRVHSPFLLWNKLTEWTHLLLKVLQSSMSLLFTWRLEKILHFSPLKPTLTRLVQHTAFWWVHVFSILQFSCRQLFLFYTRSPPHSLSSIIRVTCYTYKVLCCLQILKDVPRMTSLAHLFQEKRIQEVSISFTTMLIIVQI